MTAANPMQRGRSRGRVMSDSSVLPLSDATPSPPRRRPSPPRRASAPDDGAFRVTLDNFEGPFDLLLNLISKRQLDVTEVALSQVTDEFIAYLAGMDTWDLGKATEFLVVAATLLDLKAARLLPAAEVEDEEDLALLEARDLLFARLLQYRAYKLAAALPAGARPAASRGGTAAPSSSSRGSPNLLPEVLIGVEPAAVRRHRRRRAGAQAGAAGDDRPRPRPAGQRAPSTCRSCASGCAAAARRRSARWSPTARSRSRSSPASSACSSCTATGRSPSTRPRR